MPPRTLNKLDNIPNYIQSGPKFIAIMTYALVTAIIISIITVLTITKNNNNGDVKIFLLARWAARKLSFN